MRMSKKAPREREGLSFCVDNNRERSASSGNSRYSAASFGFSTPRRI
jgi:hypothetical protein